MRKAASAAARALPARVYPAAIRVAVPLCIASVAAACGILGDDAPALPTAPEARAFYDEHAGVLDVRLNGNVVELDVAQPDTQLRRGGSLWARVGPYIHLFSPSTRTLFERYPDLAAVRVITHTPGSREVARAMLVRDTMSELLWRRSLNLLGHALQEGTSDPDRLSDLAEWGEAHTRHRYNAAFVPVPE